MKKNQIKTKIKNIQKPKIDNTPKIKISKTFASILVFIIPILLYIQTIKFGFVNFDDNSIIIKNIKYLSNFSNIFNAFATDQFIDKSSAFYRPIGTISYMLDIQLSSANHAWMFHFINVLLFGIASFLMFLFLQKFRIAVKTALCIALIFCVHPLFTSTVAFIPNRAELLLIIFSLASFIFFIDFNEKGGSVYLILHWITFTIALFCKETAVVLILLFTFYYFTFSFEKKFEKKYLWNILLYAVSVMVWYWLRSIAITGGVKHGTEFGITTFFENIRIIPEAIAKFFIPIDNAPIPCFTIFKTCAGLLIIAALIYFSFKNNERTWKEKTFCICWFLLLLMPSMFYKIDVIDYLDHRFMLPMTGIVLLLIFVIPQKTIEEIFIDKTILLVVVIIALSVLSFVKTNPYSSPKTFFISAVEDNPNSVFCNKNLGNIYVNEKSYEKAITCYSKAINIKPDYTAYNELGVAYDIMGSYENAITNYSKAISLEPNLLDAYYNRGAMYAEHNEIGKAITDFNKVIQLKPDNADAYFDVGAIYLTQKKYDNAVKYFSKAIDIKPDFANAYRIRSAAYRSQGLTDKAKRDKEKYIELSKNNKKNKSE